MEHTVADVGGTEASGGLDDARRRIKRAREELERARREEAEAIDELEHAERELEAALERPAHPEHAFFVGATRYETDQPRLTGAQIKAKVSGWPAGWALSLEGDGDAPDRLIRDDEEVCFERRHEPLHFIQVPPATFG